MLEHLRMIIPYLDNVRSYLDAMQVTYKDLTPYIPHIGSCDPLAELVTSEYMVIGIRYENKGIKLTIRKEQWK